MKEQQQIRHWADRTVDQLIAEKGNGPFLIASGISPSGRIHVGNAREVVTADIINRVLKERGIETKFVFIADDYEPVRKVYPFLDAEIYEQYVGAPISEIPAPSGEEGLTYSEYFLRPFIESLGKLKIDAEIIRASDLYRDGVLLEQMISALKNRDKIAEILNRITGKEILDNWSPFVPHCRNCGSMKAAVLTNWNEETNDISYHCKKCGNEATVPMVGNGKLTWRVDWPARWAALGVDIEPFGKDHGGKGGSYDTGKEIVKEIFGKDEPFPILYEWIRLKGLGDMSSSKGNVVAIEEVLDVVPPDVLRYFITRPAPKSSLGLDLVKQLLNLVDEVDDETKKQRDVRSIELSQSGGFKPIGIPFNHLINVFQIAQEDIEKVKQILKRTGFSWSSDDALAERCSYAKKWLNRFATDDYKFHVVDALPESVSELPEEQKKVLGFVAEWLEKNPAAEGDEIHQAIYNISKENEIGMGKICQAFYKAMIDKNRGPRAGWFIAMVGTDVVSKRLREAAGS